MIRQALIGLAMLLSGSAHAHDFRVGDLVVAHPHSHPIAQSAPTGIGYLTIINQGSTPDRLVGVTSPFPDATLHESILEDGIARMVAVQAIEVPAGTMVKLEPGGTHIMFMGLSGTELAIGDAFKATLVFEHAGEIEVDFWIESRDPNAPQVDHSQHGAAPQAAPADEMSNLRAALRDAFRAEVDVLSLAVVEDTAVAGWITPNEGGRAFLRQGDEGWSLQVISGASLTTQSGLQARAIPPRHAQTLRVAIQDAESALSAAELARIDAFEGTIYLD